MSGIKRFFSPVARPNASTRPGAAHTPTSPLNSVTNHQQTMSKTPEKEAQLTRKLAADLVFTPDGQQTPKRPRITTDHDPNITPKTGFQASCDYRITPRSYNPSPNRNGPPITPRRQYSSPVSSPKPATNTDADSIQHLHLSYKFMFPPHRRDIQKREPDDPDYDEKTIHIPDNFLDAQTPALRQWWLIKQRNMDAILFFKMGKFYELFNDDAVVGVNNLDIAYMKGDETKPAHAGFPEVSFDKYSKILIDRGFKVIRIEQTETPAMMEERCQLTGRRGKFDKVVRREVCRVTTKGTQMLGIMDSVFHTSNNQYLLAICEQPHTDATGERQGNQKVFGVCFVDVTISKLYLGQFVDDHNLSRLNILLAHHKPTEVLHERSNLSQQSLQAIMKTGALINVLKPTKEFWPIKKTLTYLKTEHIFQDDYSNSGWPETLKALFHEGDGSESLLALEPQYESRLALSCFGAIVYYLQSQLIAGQVLQCCTFEMYQTPLVKSNGLPDQSDSTRKTIIPPMIMDHIALRNLEVFENSAGGTKCTLFESINNCKTHFGQRLLKNWLCSPLCDVKQIENRMDAISELIKNENASLMNEIVHVLANTPDIERLLARIKSQCFKSESDSRAIMFDGHQYSKAKITSFLNLLTNFKRLQKFIASVSKLQCVQSCDSPVLKRLLTFTTNGGLFPDYASTLDYFENAFDHEIAKKTGQIIPASGVDEDYDKCQAQIEGMKRKLDDYLEEQKGVLRCRSLEFFGSAKNRYQIQVPEQYCKNIPDEYRIETTRKGYKRYYTPKIDKLFQKLTTYEEDLKRILDGIMSNIFESFSRKIALWSSTVECVAILDVLQSMANFVRSLKANDIDVCRPEFVENQQKPFLEYSNGRHPGIIKLNPNYIANDLKLDDELLLLSGANMGGKSTLMRQTALLVVLSQIGCYVPASKLRLTPVDRIFSRLGASDRLIEGESTFYTELIETSAMLRCASKDSLLLLDELGRGTSTYDGTAIAYSVLNEISNNIRCRCLFSTHYHTLVRDYCNVERIRLAHMACKVEKSSDAVQDGDEVNLDPLKENITFLYKVAEGPVGRSYGFNVAKLAGIKDEIVKEAFRKAKEFELRCNVLETMHKLSIGDNHDKDEFKKRVLASLGKK